MMNATGRKTPIGVENRGIGNGNKEQEVPYSLFFLPMGGIGVWVHQPITIRWKFIFHVNNY